MKNKLELVYKACYNANIDKFTKILENIKDKKQKEKVKSMFENHMKEISKFIINSTFQKTGILDENFIKKLHKIHYPPHYRETKKNQQGKDIVFMIPGEYKIFPNFPRVKPKDVSKNMKNIINYYNTNIKTSKNKFDTIAVFILNFFKVHPFGNGNGALASLLMDLLLIKNNLKPLGLKKGYKNKDFKLNFYKAIEKSIEEKTGKYFLDILKKIA